LIALVSALLACLIAIVIYMRTNPVKGYLIFERVGLAEELDRIPLSHGLRSVTVKSRELATRHPIIPFARIRVRNIAGEAEGKRSIAVTARYAENGQIEETLTDGGTAVPIGFDMMMYYKYRE